MKQMLIQLILKLLGKIVEIFNINMNSISQWHKKGNTHKISKKTNNNSTTDDSAPKIVQIGANTEIVFTIKSFFSLIGAILVIFYGFYQLVIVPKENTMEKHYQEMFDAQRGQNTIFYQDLGNINSSLGSLNSTTSSLVEMINQIKMNNQSSSKIGGSIGNTNYNKSTNSIDLNNH